MPILDLRERSYRIDIRIKILYKITKITIYGPYYPPSAKRRLETLIDKLKRIGFEDINIVEERDNILDESGQSLDSREKSFYYIDNSDYNIFIYLREGDKAGLAIELEHAKKSEQIIKRSLVIIEMVNESDDTEIIVTELLKSNPNFIEIERCKVPIDKDEILFEKVKAFLMRNILNEIIER